MSYNTHDNTMLLQKSDFLLYIAGLMLVGMARRQMYDPENQDWAKYVGYWTVTQLDIQQMALSTKDYARKNNMRFLLWMEPD